MEIVLNGEAYESESLSNVRGLIENLQLGGKRVAVMVNDEIVRRADYDESLIAPGDRIEIVHMVGGG